jgi:urease subunit beta
MVPGEIIGRSEPVIINDGLPVTSIPVRNTGSVPVHITAHYHLFELNPRLAFDRRKAWGMRPDLAADRSIRVEPGMTVDVRMVPIGGRRVIHGFTGAVDGPIDAIDPGVALRTLIDRGFLHEPLDPQ